MRFSIEIKRSAYKELERIARPRRRPLVDAIDRLSENPFLGRVLKGELQGLRRLRVGNYRVLYEVREDTLVVLVVRIAHRQGAYRR
ncbi:MAG: type II toxin-antitoxin system RelE/ParE family toxin [Gammaproteobacteria bacterium]|nr:type II toxin-antitoxin system RelE/ParE family toxin [Gammaproteobacteria bacterium]